jgi:TRAP-type C4-dicarboxylate transport system permease small subunit
VEPSLLVILGVSVASAAWLTFTLRDQWWQPGIGSRLWNLIETGLGLFLMIAMLYTTTTQVIVRYGLSDYLILPWTEELSRVLLVWVAFWGAAMVQRSDGHIAVEVFYNLLGPTGRLCVRVFGDMATLAFLALVVWQGWLVAESQFPIPMITMSFSSALYALSVPVCGALMIVHTLLIVIRRRRAISIETTGTPGA